MAKLISITEAEKILHLSRPTVIKLMDRGDIANLRVGDRKRFTTQESIDAYLEANTAPRG